MAISSNDYSRLEEIRNKMIELLEEARFIVRMSDRHVYERAQAYAFGWIESGLDSGNPYDTDFGKILNELTIEDEEDEDLDEEDEDEEQS